MYMDLQQEDPEKNRKRGWVVFLFCVAFLIGITQCAKGQLCVTRLNSKADGKVLIRKEVCWTLEFGVFNTKGGADTIFLGLVADSLNDSKYDIRIFVYYPKGTRLDSSYLDIGFEGNGIETLKPEFVLESKNYVEYTVTRQQCFKMMYYKTEYVNFHIERNDLSFVDDCSKYLQGFFDKL